MSPSTGTTCDDGSGHCTLRAAIDAANNLNGATVVVNVPTGTYGLTTGTVSVTNVGGTELLGTGPGVLITNGGATSSILEVDSVTSPSSVTTGGFLALNNVTLTGSAGEALVLDDYNVTATATNTNFVNNSEDGDGGAVWSDGQFWATNSVFDGNTSTSRGGAFYNQDGSARFTV